MGTDDIFFRAPSTRPNKEENPYPLLCVRGVGEHRNATHRVRVANQQVSDQSDNDPSFRPPAYLSSLNSSERDAASGAGGRKLLVGNSSQMMQRSDGGDFALIDAALDRIALAAPLVEKRILLVCCEAVKRDGRHHSRRGRTYPCDCRYAGLSATGNA